MKRLATVVFCCSLLFVAPLRAQDPPTVAATLERWRAAWIAADAEGLRALLSPDAQPTGALEAGAEQPGTLLRRLEWQVYRQSSADQDLVAAWLAWRASFLETPDVELGLAALGEPGPRGRTAQVELFAWGVARGGRRGDTLTWEVGFDAAGQIRSWSLVAGEAVSGAGDLLREEGQALLGAAATGQGGGLAAADLTGDGWLDLLLLRGGRLVVLHNVEGQRFAPLTVRGLEQAPSGAQEVLALDLDGDGDRELILGLGAAGAAVLENTGSVTAPACGAPRLLEGAPAHRLTAGDLDRDGRLDLVVLGETGGSSSLLASAQVGWRVWRQSEPLSFEVGGAGPQVPGQARGLALLDVDRDDDLDLYLARGEGLDALLLNDGQGNLAEGTLPVAAGAGQGVGVGDLNGDGLLDLAVAGDRPGRRWPLSGVAGRENLEVYLEERNLRLPSSDLFSGVRLLLSTEQARVRLCPRPAGWGWTAGVVLLDANGDGHLDLFLPGDADPLAGRFDAVAQATFGAGPGPGASPGPGQGLPQRSRLLLYVGGLGGQGESPRYADAGPAFGVEGPGDASGALALDVDRDGDDDLIVNQSSGPPRLFRNRAAGRRGWLEVTLAGPPGNPDGIGARVGVTIVPPEEPQLARLGPPAVQVRSVCAGPTSGGGLRFGLGEIQQVADVFVRWPDGKLEHFGGGRPGQRVQARYGQGSATPTVPQPLPEVPQSDLTQGQLPPWWLILGMVIPPIFVVGMALVANALRPKAPQ